MKVIAWFKDGSFYTVEVPQKCEEYGPAYAIEKAKELLGSQLLGEDRGMIDHWEVEEDFL
jgi:hypothetical protein